MKTKIVLFLVILASGLAAANFVFAAECRKDCGTIEECDRFISECAQVLDLYESANLKNRETLAQFETQVKRFEQMIQSASQQIDNLEKNILNREVDLGVQKILLAQRVRRFYIYQRGYFQAGIFFANKDSAHFIRGLFYQQLVANKDKEAIEDLSQQLAELLEDKKKLEERQNWLAARKKEAESQAAFLKGEIAKAEDYIGELSSTIATLTAKQKTLLTARSGTFTSSVGEVPVSSIPCSGPPGSPTYCSPGSNWFAAFSFGAWTHRKGMSQYGAKGRADAGQNASQILQAYYGKTPVSQDTSGTISVIGFGNLDFENYYLLGIAEMPSSWHPEALKAQAIAARTYAYRYKIEGRAICTTEACQVFSKSKADNPPAAWREAVEQTRGQILEEVVAYYSSTAGGYLTTSGWDTTDSQGGEGFASRAWESKAGSPWFYSSWYTKTYNPNSAKCGRSHPWLNQEEIADILNAWLVLNKQGSDDRILPITINQCPIDGVTGNPYSIDELRNKANQFGGAFTSVSSARVVYSNDGYTASVSLETNRGGITISGEEFRKAFNLRAPGYIAILSPLFNLEKSQ